MNAPLVSQHRRTFRSHCEVALDIDAPASKVWQLMSDGAGMARWNSTISQVRGEIALGRQLAIQVPAAPGRTFKPRVVAFEPGRRMVWADGMAPMFKGVRTFLISEPAPGRTHFEMKEVFSGLLLPFIRSSLPDFGAIFERFAQDLRREAERQPAAGQ